MLLASNFSVKKWFIFTLLCKHIQASEHKDKPNCTFQFQLGKEVMVSSSCSVQSSKIKSGYINSHYKSSGMWWVPEISLQLSYCFIFFIHFHSLWNSWVPWFPQVTELTFNTSTLEIVYGFLTPRIVQQTKQACNHSNCGREKNQVSAMKLQCISNSCKWYSFIFHM